MSDTEKKKNGFAKKWRYWILSLPGGLQGQRS